MESLLKKARDLDLKGPGRLKVVVVFWFFGVGFFFFGFWNDRKEK